MTKPNDDAYANASHIPGADAYPPRWAAFAAEFRERCDWREIPYGTGERERLDLFLPAGRPAGLVVFVHGGYWLRFDRRDWSWLAAGPLARGWAVAMPSYPLAPAARIADITAAVARAVDAAAEAVPGPVRLAGHSAGGHLVARMVCGAAGQAADRIAACVPISPVADLRPLIETSMNDDFGLDEASARAESPALLEKSLDVPVHVWVGADERPAFLDQARWLARAWGAGLTVAAGRHHFDVIDSLARPDGALTEALLA